MTCTVEKTKFWAIVFTLGAFLSLATGSSFASGVFEKTKEERLLPGRWMKARFTVYNDGRTVAVVESSSSHFTRGLRNHSVFAVYLDSQGKVLYVSPIIKGKTVGGKGDFTTSSESRVLKTFFVPAPVASQLGDIKFHFDSGDMNSARKALKEFCSAVEESAAMLQIEVPIDCK